MERRSYFSKHCFFIYIVVKLVVTATKDKSPTDS